MEITLIQTQPRNVVFGIDDLEITSIDLLIKQITIKKFINQFSRQFTTNDIVTIQQKYQAPVSASTKYDK